MKCTKILSQSFKNKIIFQIFIELLLKFFFKNQYGLCEEMYFDMFMRDLLIDEHNYILALQCILQRPRHYFKNVNQMKYK
jgi:hypothetical protein